MNVATATEQQPHEVMSTLTNAVVASRCLHVVAELGVADDVADEPVSAQALAAGCGADAGALDRTSTPGAEEAPCTHCCSQ